jgi:AcrR family transcriptional regulator
MGVGVSETGRHAGRRRRRDAERSRTLILDAAEQVFAQHGYLGASLSAIGEAAEVSATLPAYFFSNKASLYRAVIDRLFVDRNEILGEPGTPAVAARARPAGGRPNPRRADRTAPQRCSEPGRGSRVLANAGSKTPRSGERGYGVT